MQRNLVGALIVVLALGVAACGSSGSKPLSAARLRAQATAVCQDVGRQVRALQLSATPASMRTSLARAATVLSDGVARLHALTPPRELASRYDLFVAWKASQRDAARELSRSGGRADLSARSRQAVLAHHNPVWTLAHQLDLPACA